jgi:hypothetical protein
MLKMEKMEEYSGMFQNREKKTLKISYWKHPIPLVTFLAAGAAYTTCLVVHFCKYIFGKSI